MQTTLPPRRIVAAELPSLLDMLFVATSDPVAVLPEAIYENWTCRLPGGPFAPLAIVEPAAVEAVMFDDGTRYGRTPQLQRLMRRAWNNGLAASQGDDWRRQRRAAAAPLRPQSLGAYVPAMQAAGARASEQWPVSVPFDLIPLTGRMVADTVLSTLLLGAHEVADLDSLVSDLRVFMRRITKFGAADFLPLPETWIDQLRGIPDAPARTRLRAFAEALTQVRTNPPDPAEDIPASLRGQAPMLDNIFGFMTASFETTAMAVAWSLYLMALYPDWQTRLREEGRTAVALDGQAALDALPLTRQVVREALRLYPPAPGLVRGCLQAGKLLGEPVAKGQIVLIPVYVIHRHHKLWRMPDAFHPERFAEVDPQRPRGAYMPFGAGPRMCAASNFAEAEICVLVSRLIGLRRFETAAPLPEVTTQVVTSSATGLWVTAEPV